MKKAFSLVELSIVLVILGLLVGGVLSGQSLIRAAELRAVSSEHSRYVAASQSFRDKYFALPGDMSNATRFWGRLNANADCVTNSSAAVAAPGACDGNGDGVPQFAAGTSQSGEFAQFWRHLAQAGLIEGTYSGLAGAVGSGQHCVIGTDCPKSRLSNGGWGVWPGGIYVGNAAFFAMDYGNLLVFGAQQSNNIPVGTALKVEEAWNIDTKLDDGHPARGGVIAGYWGTCTTVNSGVASETNLDVSYTLSSAAVGCSLLFRRAI